MYYRKRDTSGKSFPTTPLLTSTCCISVRAGR